MEEDWRNYCKKAGVYITPIHPNDISRREGFESGYKAGKTRGWKYGLIIGGIIGAIAIATLSKIGMNKETELEKRIQNTIMTSP